MQEGDDEKTKKQTELDEFVDDFAKKMRKAKRKKVTESGTTGDDATPSAMSENEEKDNDEAVKSDVDIDEDDDDGADLEDVS